MQHKITAPTWAEINLDNIRYNLKNIKKLLNEDTKVCAVLKANAYGHGAVKIAKLLENENVSHFAVARLEEAIELRENNITLPILCLGYIPEQSLELAIRNNVIITIYSLEMAEKLNNIAMRIKENVFVHIKIDTGMTRIGFQPTEDSIKDIKLINGLECINLEGIYTHFATADELDKNFTNIQVQRFNFVVDRLEQDGINIPIKHVSNSAATMDLPELKYDMVRCGIVLYGHYPSDDVLKERLQLKPVMTLKTTVAHIKEINPNVGISYGLKYKSSNKERIVTIPIGYADGFTRMQQNPKVSINGNYFDVVGRICMDQCMVKVDKDIELNIGDQVILFGDDSRNAEDIANDLGTINYEVLCMISRRVDRVYMERNAILQVDSYLIK
ncbi:alanine racemase [Romboutsia lituseburensis]|uniref:Alanine racemase n=1 Tax=Romboutsia lituseburensis DSM 797 TaxID=1121325 RepID=A0A1G9TT39_9FIRM|nr:alanine racemase [Romboutsia lituseburensis]CEH32695.1 Alanine racemase [Romboutsia lituseburensis]SDM50822.1 alanine racemase [Romboutsia lituseburensis DSM 797]